MERPVLFNCGRTGTRDWRAMPLASTTPPLFSSCFFLFFLQCPRRREARAHENDFESLGGLFPSSPPRRVVRALSSWALDRSRGGSAFLKKKKAGTQPPPFPSPFLQRDRSRTEGPLFPPPFSPFPLSPFHFLSRDLGDSIRRKGEHKRRVLFFAVSSANTGDYRPQRMEIK